MPGDAQDDRRGEPVAVRHAPARRGDDRLEAAIRKLQSRQARAGHELTGRTPMASAIAERSSVMQTRPWRVCQLSRFARGAVTAAYAPVFHAYALAQRRNCCRIRASDPHRERANRYTLARGTTIPRVYAPLSVD